MTVIVCEMLPSPPAGQIIHRGLAYSLWSNFSAFEGEPLPLTAHCVDPDGGPVVVAWDLDGDGMFDDGIGQHAILVPTRTDTIRVSIRMTDDEGQRSYASVSIRVDRSAVDFDDVFRAKAPVVGVLADVITPTVGQVVTFLGTAGDVDSYVLSWDFDGDGIEDASDPSPGTTFIPVAHAFSTPGIYTPELTVTDSEGFVSHAYVTVVVLACSDAGDEPPLSTVECDCGARVILHGGLTELVIECDPPRGGLLAGITSVAGTGRPPDDPLATGLTVTDHDGLVFATPAPAPRPVGATPIRISAESLHVDGPARIVPYTITVRVEDPGVWVYVMKCRVSVMHLGVVANMRVAGDPPFHTGDFTIYTPPSEQDDVLEIAELELDFDIQVPAWSQVDDVRDLPAGWAAEISQDRLRIFLEQGGGGLPLRPGALPFRFKVDFRTSDAEQFPLSGEIRFYGREGDLLGTEPLNVK